MSTSDDDIPFEGEITSIDGQFLGQTVSFQR